MTKKTKKTKAVESEENVAVSTNRSGQLILSNPSYKKQTVLVEFENGKKEKHQVHRGVNNDCYLYLEGEQINFYELEGGDWLEQMLN